jgi:predicted cupin superfamily sugar epimerase
MTATDIITKLHLSKHPEGGYYKETYRSTDELETSIGKRNVSTAIYFLLEGNDKSKFHRIKSDECWFFHQGNAVEIFILSDEGLKTILLGNEIFSNEIPQAVVPANSWFAARVKNESGFALVSCTVAPGFDFRDFELAEPQMLMKKFPDQSDLVFKFTSGES